jgi:CRISPR-associated protein Cmr2
VLDRDTAGHQLDDFVEWYDAWTAYDPDAEAGPASYEARRLQVERLLAGRKALRDFGRAHGVDGRPKSALDPSREAVVDLDKDATGEAARLLHARRNEPLDAISLIKRLDGQERFVSTARVAIDPYLRAARLVSDESYRLLGDLAERAGNLADTDLAERFRATEKNGLAHYADFPYDSQLFYALSEEAARRQLGPWEGTPREPALRKAVGEFFDIMQRFRDDMREMGDPPAYLAVLRADGDRMGAAIGDLGSIPAHRDLSLQLGTFAEAAGEIVRKHHGAMIYAGGDDVLAFLPLDTALPCADALRRKFAEIIDNTLREHPEVEHAPTLSVGVGIGHYADHLQTLLKRAGDAEKAAKGPRDALAVLFQAHSGGGAPRIVTHSWESDPVFTHWATALEFHRHDTLPDGAAYELDALLREMRAADAHGVFDDAAARDELLIKEAVRILKRKQPEHGKEKIRDDIVEAVRDRLEDPPGDQSAIDVLGAFVSEVIVARRMYRLLLDQRSEGVELWNGALRPVVSPAPAEPVEARS